MTTSPYPRLAPPNTNGFHTKQCTWITRRLGTEPNNS